MVYKQHHGYYNNIHYNCIILVVCTPTKQTNRAVRNLKYKLLNCVHIVPKFTRAVYKYIHNIIQGVSGWYGIYIFKLPTNWLCGSSCRYTLYACDYVFMYKVPKWNLILSYHVCPCNAIFIVRNCHCSPSIFIHINKRARVGGIIIQHCLRMIYLIMRRIT